MRTRHLVLATVAAAGLAGLAVLPRVASSAEGTARPAEFISAVPRGPAEPVVHRFRGPGGKCATVSGTGDRPDGAAVVLRPCGDDPRQVFTGTSAGEARTLAGMCLDIAWNSGDDGAKIQVAVCNGSPAQQWYVTAGNGAPTGLHSESHDKCVDVRGRSTADGAPLELWECVRGAATQTWALIPA